MSSLDNIKEQARELIVEETYHNWMLYYSKFNWVSNWATYNDLDDTTKEFWRNHVKTILRKVRLESLALKSDKIISKE